MRKILLLLLYLFPIGLVAQNENDIIIYLDSTFATTSNGDHTYYTIIKNSKIKQKEYEVVQYYVSGKIESEGRSRSNEYFDKIGKITSYYENGNMKSLKFYKEYYPEGKCTFWHENGTKKAEGEYIVIPLKEFKNFKTSKLKINNYWNNENIQKVINGNGALEDDGMFDVYDPNSISLGKIKNGFKDETWTGKSKNPKLQFTELYKDGELISGTSVDELNQSYSYSETRKVATPAGGMNVFYKYIQNKFIQPEDESFKGGKTITRFDIDNQGNISNARNSRSLTPETDNQALKLIEEFKRFEPAEFRGVKIKSTYTLPIIIYGNN